jgi:hypothetical protein
MPLLVRPSQIPHVLLILYRTVYRAFQFSSLLGQEQTMTPDGPSPNTSTTGLALRGTGSPYTLAAIISSIYLALIAGDSVFR